MSKTFCIRVVLLSVLLTLAVSVGSAGAHWPYSSATVRTDLMFFSNFDGMCGGGDEGCDQQSIAAWDLNPLRVGDHSYRIGGQWSERDYVRGWGHCTAHVRVFSHAENATLSGRFNIGEVYWTSRSNTNIECGDGPT